VWGRGNSLPVVGLVVLWPALLALFEVEVGKAVEAPKPSTRLICNKTVKRDGSNWYHIECRCGSPYRTPPYNYTRQFYKSDWEGERFAKLLSELTEQGWFVQSNEGDPRTWTYNCAKCVAKAKANLAREEINE